MSPSTRWSTLVDDIEMRISHVLRGEDLLSSTPRQLAMRFYLGALVPQFGHLPYVMGGKQSSASATRSRISTPTWSRGTSRRWPTTSPCSVVHRRRPEFFSLTEMAEHFDEGCQRQPRAIRPEEVHRDQR